MIYLEKVGKKSLSNIYFCNFYNFLIYNVQIIFKGFFKVNRSFRNSLINIHYDVHLKSLGEFSLQILMNNTLPFFVSE